MPLSIATYRRVPTRFSPRVIQTCMDLGGWTMKQRTNVPGSPPNSNTNFLFFPNKDGIGRLGVDPDKGIIDYLDEKAHASASGNAKRVPTDKEAQDLARSFLKKLDIDESNLVHHADGTLRMYGGRSIQGRRGVEEVITRSVYLTRQVDHIPFNGLGQNGGIWITLGDHAKISELRVVWPTLQLIERRTTATRAELEERIRQGKAILVSSETSDVILANLSSLTKLTVKQITPVYRGGNGFELDEVIQPFASLDVVAHFPRTNYQAMIDCSIFSVK
ncbi:MAG TPA: hypothetical protein VK846_07395 [Candidatus Limnocylindria bacterium]|nr:hypothetical protein [Candidatus Limnocylindria bacterium]